MTNLIKPVHQKFILNFMPLKLYSRSKSPWYPLDRRLDGSQSRFGRRREEKILISLGPELRSLGRTALIQSLYRLRYPGSLVFLWNLWKLLNGLFGPTLVSSLPFDLLCLVRPVRSFNPRIHRSQDYREAEALPQH
jgi:hypothetical protein